MIEETKKELPVLTKAAISRHVPAIVRNYNEITNQHRKRGFIYREAGISDDFRKTTFERFAEVYFAIATANRESGRLIEAGLEKCFSVVDSFYLNPLPRDFWEIEETMSNSMVELRKAQINGDIVRLALAANRIEQCAKEIVKNVTSSISLVN